MNSVHSRNRTADTVLPIKHGDSYAFTVEITDGYEKTAEMLEGANPIQFTVSGVVGTIAMMLAAEKQTDFILAIVGEELGFAGIIVVLILYSLWGFFAVRIALKAKERCGMLMAWALTVGVMLQAAINFGAMSGCFPTKGMPAPFISYGGTNVIVALMAIGMIFSVGLRIELPRARIRGKINKPIFYKGGR